MLRRAALVIVPLLLAAPACSDDDTDRSAVTSVPEDRSTTSSTTAVVRTPAPDVIPDDEALITEEYVAGVLDALYRASGDAIRSSVEAGELTEATIDTIDALHTVDSSVTQVENLVDAELEGFARYRPEPGYVRTSIVDLLEARPDCIVAEVTLDASEVLVSPPSLSGLRIALRLVPAEEEQRASGLNPTAWIIAGSTITDDGSEPELGCEG